MKTEEKTNSYGLRFANDQAMREWEDYIAKRLAQAAQTPLIAHEDMRGHLRKLREKSRGVPHSVA